VTSKGMDGVCVFGLLGVRWLHVRPSESDRRLNVMSVARGKWVPENRSLSGAAVYAGRQASIHDIRTQYMYTLTQQIHTYR